MLREDNKEHEPFEVNTSGKQPQPIRHDCNIYLFFF